ncbi:MULTISPECIES: hypothetical protein [unclassified Wenzhouxiangella]|uniref:hypothetical protein n=1 Tax=unclassified Wenzhouxiangella TaxID=2613841 RepID=UPI000E328793|nr:MULTISPECIES: hypothetical protein [unclassified Wenzhouxiangella]RFF26763.1 hypothetical protein DZK25_11380 [Wenzhouxiangella sp. 15181]RFP67727.1 hypothetical protein DZK26_11425 [Wenzhouxiangella sp. 15190]
MRTIFVLYALLLIVPDAHAYLDPGSGSAILQGILGALAAIALTLKLYWHRFLRLIGLRKPSEDKRESPGQSEARSNNENT